MKRIVCLVFLLLALAACGRKEEARPAYTSFLLAPGSRWFLAKVTQVAAEWSFVLS